MSDDDSDWKRKLRFGELETPFTHFTLIADGSIMEANENLGTIEGACVMALKVWADDPEQAADMLIEVANAFAFKIDKNVEVCATEPDRPPDERPYAYDVQLLPPDTCEA